MYVEYIYSGRVTLEKNKLQEFMEVGESLIIQGLTPSHPDTQSDNTRLATDSLTPSHPDTQSDNTRLATDSLTPSHPDTQ